jgi:hypothetical protein
VFRGIQELHPQFKELRVLLIFKGLKVPKGGQVVQVLRLQVHKVLKVLKDLKEVKVVLDQRGQLDHKGAKELKDL